MAKVEPYHSSSAIDDQVYHDHDDCPVGNVIPENDRERGTSGFRRCGKCYEMDVQSS